MNKNWIKRFFSDFTPAKLGIVTGLLAAFFLMLACWLYFHAAAACALTGAILALVAAISAIVHGNKTGSW